MLISTSVYEAISEERLQLTWSGTDLRICNALAGRSGTQPFLSPVAIESRCASKCKVCAEESGKGFVSGVTCLPLGVHRHARRRLFTAKKPKILPQMISDLRSDNAFREDDMIMQQHCQSFSRLFHSCFIWS